MPADTPDVAPELPDLAVLGSPTGRMPPPPGAGISEERFNKEKEQENIRGRIAKALVYTFVAFVALVTMTALLTQLFCAWNSSCAKPEFELTAIRTLIELILTPLVGLVGAVSGFYFGEKSASPGKPG